MNAPRIIPAGPMGLDDILPLIPSGGQRGLRLTPPRPLGRMKAGTL